jgi:hypothetical protein
MPKDKQKYTRKYRRSSKKYGQKSQRSRSYRRHKGGVDKSDEEQIRDLKNIISMVLDLFNKAKKILVNIS